MILDGILNPFYKKTMNAVMNTVAKKLLSRHVTLKCKIQNEKLMDS